MLCAGEDMRLPTVREIICFQYTLLAHVTLLFLLFAVFLAPVVFAVVGLAVGIILVPVASLFVCIRVYIRQLDAFIVLIYFTSLYYSSSWPLCYTCL